MRDVCFIADVAVLPRWARVSQLLDYVAGVHPRFDRAKAEGFLAKTTIRRTSRVRELSKGMVTQLHLALVMAIDARLLVLDEPTLGLDILYRKQFYDSLLNDYFDRNRTIVVATHQVEEIEHVLTDVMFIDRGRIVFDRSMEELESHYLEVMVRPEQVAAARALKPMHERQAIGGSILLFDGVDRQQLAALGDVRTPGIADLFVAVMGNQSRPGTRSGAMNTQSNAIPDTPIAAQGFAPAVIPESRLMYWSVRRELWENRSIYIAPLAVAGLILFGFLISTFRLAAQDATPRWRSTRCSSTSCSHSRTTSLRSSSWATTFIVAVFYCLDALHGERRDRSILFWKSLPVSDLTTVLSKASYSAGGSSAAHLRDHRGHAIDHAADEQRRTAGKRFECRDVMDPAFVAPDVAGAALPSCDDSFALVCANLRLAAAGLSLGAARANSMGRATAARDRAG